MRILIRFQRKTFQFSVFQFSDFRTNLTWNNYLRFWFSVVILFPEFFLRQLTTNVLLLCSVAWNLRLNITNIKIRLEWTAFFRKKKPSPSHCAKQLLVVRLFWKKKVVVKFIFCAIFSSFYFHFSTFTFLNLCAKLFKFLLLFFGKTVH